MSTDTGELIGLLAGFLEAEVLPEVGGRTRGELRATAKLLANLREEMEGRPEVERLLETDLREQLEGAAASFDGEELGAVDRLLARLSEAGGDANPADQGRTALLRLVARDYVDLLASGETSDSRERLAALYRVLRDDALRRHSWQSVFSG
jgi:hypothetical protein